MKRKLKLALAAIISIMAFFMADNIIYFAMMKGINNYYGLNSDSKILLIGHSHLMLATDKELMENKLNMKVSKYCREGVNVTDKKMMVEHFLNNGHADSLKYVLYGVDLATFTGEGLSKNSYKLFYPFIDNSFVDDYINRQSSKADYWLHKLIKTTRFNDDGLKNSALRGWIGNWDNFKNNTIDIDWYKKWRDDGNERNITMNDSIISQFEQTIQLLTSHRIKVILVNTPTLDLLNNYEPEKYKRMMEWFTQFADNNTMVEYWDFNPKYAADHSIFSDRLHLNRKGQEVITEELINHLKVILDEDSN